MSLQAAAEALSALAANGVTDRLLLLIGAMALETQANTIVDRDLLDAAAGCARWRQAGPDAGQTRVFLHKRRKTPTELGN